MCDEGVAQHVRKIPGREKGVLSSDYRTIGAPVPEQSQRPEVPEGKL
jgi:hypothetical protein